MLIMRFWQILKNDYVRKSCFLAYWMYNAFSISKTGEIGCFPILTETEKHEFKIV